MLQASELWFVHKAYTSVSFHQITVQWKFRKENLRMVTQKSHWYLLCWCY